MAGPIRIAILANGSQARREINQVNGALGLLQKSGKRGLALAGIGGLSAGLAGFAKSAVDAEREFSLTMRTIQANTGATAAEIDRMGKFAVKAGGEMGFSGREAAGAMLELAKAGLDAKTIMGGGLASTLKVAAAGGTDLATASTIAANAMNAFSIAGKDLDSIAVALAGGANASTASVESLGIALSQVGPGATTAGLSLQETIATLAAFDNAGIKGSDSGTSLKTMLTRLVPQTKAARQEMDRLGLDFTKADGSFVSLEQIAGRLKSSLGKLSDEQRTTALRIIFGSDATRAATVLMREGTAGIRKYIKATHDQASAQKAVEARTSGTEGAIKRMNAAVEKAKLKLGGELAPVVIKGADAFGDKFVPAVESGIKAGKEIGQALAPAAKEISEALKNLAGEGDGVGKFFNNVFIPALRDTSEVVGDVVNFIDELPGPVKEVGVQAGIAALIMPRFAAGVGAATGAITLQIAKLQQLRAELTYTATRAQALSGVMSGMKTAAGVAGFVLLTQGMQQSNDTAKALMTTMGGAAVGFSVGGPVGAAVGGLAGLMLGLQDGTNRAEIAALNSTTTWKTYASTLDSVTGATTRATKSMVIQELQQNKTLSKARELGISQSTLVNGVLGQTKASGQLSAALKAEEASIREASKAYMEKYDTSIARSSDEAKAVFESLKTRRANLDAIKAEVGEVKKSTKQKREELLLLQNFPDLVITKIQTPGAVDSKRELADLAATFKLTPKQIQTVIKMNGIDASVKEVRGLAGEIVKSGKVKPSDAWRNQFKSDIGRTRRDANTGLGLLNGTLAKVGDVKPNIANGPFGRGVSADLSALSRTASAQANRVGSNIGAGMLSGVSGWASAITGKVSSMVDAAIAAGHRAADSHSPSRKTMRLGGYIGEGLVVGLERSRPKARTAGQKLVQAVLGGVDDGADGVSRAIEKITAAVRKSITGKNQGKREAAYLKSLRDEFNALRANGRAQDAVAAKLEKARDRLKDLTDQYNDYRKAIADSVRATGDVTQLGRNDQDSTVSITSLVNELTTKVQNAERFNILLQQLADKGLSRASIQQMLDAGPEAALATAEAIASGGASAITEINALQARLAKAGDSLSKDMADRYYGAGVAAAEGIVKGLEAQAKNLDKAAIRLANALVKAVKRALGIRSPSRVFAGIGDNVTKGLTLQLDANSTYVKRAGTRTAVALVDGFGRPSLEAYARQTSGATGAAPGTFRIRFTADQMSQMQRGREYVADIDYAIANGVRPTRIGVR